MRRVTQVKVKVSTPLTFLLNHTLDAETGRCKAQEETEDTDTSDTSSEDEGEEVWEETQEADAVDKLEEPIEQLSKEEIEVSKGKKR